ncbi:unnamed protein product [Prunus armeniaca]|uniref:Indole-3-acetate O-methyltransferase 1 n=1 Tax=Prunus armeniaca TaxID=36596 RepID=A0A6J5UPU7_PRUAR|nr:unnamed protein product [Prunus armeniaca]
MKGGKEELSYVNNSKVQAKHANSMLHLLKETLDRVQLSSPEFLFLVADLGCSSGSNSINTPFSLISLAMTSTPSSSSSFLWATTAAAWRRPLLPTATAPNWLQESPAPSSGGFSRRGPLTFFTRRFPCVGSHRGMNVPESVLDKRSAAYNKGRVFIHGANESTANAYKKQFQTDLASFLRSRAKELKKGGSMFLACLGRTSVDPTEQSGLGLLLGTHIQGAWDDLVQEDKDILDKLKSVFIRFSNQSDTHGYILQYVHGLITSEKGDSFNFPVYASSLQDFKEVVEADGSFTMNKLEIFNGGSPLVVNQPDDAAEVGRALANSCRSAGGVLIDAHIGEHLSNELFSQVEQRSSRHAKEILEQIQFFYVAASLSLA